MAHAYSEDYLIEQPAIQLFAELGWATVSASEESGGVNVTFGRETKSEVVLVPRLRAALEQLVPALPVEAINSAIKEFVLGLPLPPLLSKLIDLKAKDMAA